MSSPDTPRSFPARSRAAALVAVAVGVGALSLSLRATHPGAAAPAVAPAPQTGRDTVVLPAGSPRLASIQAEPARAGHEAPVLTTGRLTWDEDATSRVFPPVEGRVVRLPFGLGAHVAPGEALATLSSPDFGVAQSDAARAATDLAQARRSRDRVARLVDRGAAPRKDLEAAEADLDRARTEAERSSAKLARWRRARRVRRPALPPA